MTQPARKQEDVQDARRIATAAELAAANINPQTGLATDYLNHFNEAVMLLDMIPDVPDCVQDFMEWRPLSYAEHFNASYFTARELAIAAYEEADAAVRGEFDALTTAMTDILVAVGNAMREVRHESSRGILAGQAAGWLRPMVGQAGGVINGKAIEQDRFEIDAIMDAAS